MEVSRAEKIVDLYTKKGILHGLSGRPLKRFVILKIRKDIKKLNRRCESERNND